MSLTVCVGCERVRQDDGFALCSNCDWAAGDDECPACGSQLDWDGCCGCSLNSPRADSSWDRAA